jgi:hypothetical protein
VQACGAIYPPTIVSPHRGLNTVAKGIAELAGGAIGGEVIFVRLISVWKSSMEYTGVHEKQLYGPWLGGQAGHAAGPHRA